MDESVRSLGWAFGAWTSRGYRRARLEGRALRNTRGGETAPAPVFIVGSGRSGTHWVGGILDAHPDITVTVEQAPIFDWVTRSALDLHEERRLAPKLLRRYRLEIASAAPRVYADKSHPNIWLAETLADEFPSARFLGVHRGVYATVASMLNHPGVLSWHKTWREYPIPNRFLGITAARAHDYGRLPLAAQCAVRWRAHIDELRRLRAVLGSRFYLVCYEALQTDTAKEIDRLGRFLVLRSPIPAPDVRTGSLDRWKSEMSQEMQLQIRAVVDDTREQP